MQNIREKARISDHPIFFARTLPFLFFFNCTTYNTQTFEVMVKNEKQKCGCKRN